MNFVTFVCMYVYKYTYIYFHDVIIYTWSLVIEVDGQRLMRFTPWLVEFSTNFLLHSLDTSDSSLPVTLRNRIYN